MMASPDLKIVVASIQMANILMEKLPDVFNVYFCREGECLIVFMVRHVTKDFIHQGSVVFQCISIRHVSKDVIHHGTVLFNYISIRHVTKDFIHHGAVLIQCISLHQLDCVAN